ncbi:MAG: FCD domain-containing protein [Desulfobacterales bacterium]|nr:FCD domain-containing protein [Desulfobacterales bacterium]
MRNRNFPLKKAHSVKSISDPRDIERLRTLLNSRHRDLLLFDLAIEPGMPAKQLIGLKIKDLHGLEVGEKLPFPQRKSDPRSSVSMSHRLFQTFGRYLSEVRPALDDYLFKSRKGSGPLSRSSASRMVRGWFDRAGISGMSGLLSLRKTWADQHGTPSLKEEEQGKEILPEGDSKYRLHTIKAPTIQELVYKKLEQVIVFGHIRPGEQLIAEELARQMGVSRIPVREALGRLEARNFITIKPKKGIVVNQLSVEKLREILEVRLMVELPAAKKAAVRRSEDTLRSLELLNKQYLSARRNNDADELLRVNKEFHFTIYRESQMPTLLTMIENLWNQVSPYYHIMFRQTELSDPLSGINYHRRMVEAMRKRNPEEVCRWLRTDLTESTDFVINVFKLIETSQSYGSIHS